MKRWIRALAAGLALALVLCCVACAGLTDGETTAPQQTTMPEDTNVPIETPSITGQTEASEQLAALDLALFKKDMESDPFTLKLALTDPEARGGASGATTTGNHNNEVITPHWGG